MWRGGDITVLPLKNAQGRRTKIFRIKTAIFSIVKH